MYLEGCDYYYFFHITARYCRWFPGWCFAVVERVSWPVWTIAKIIFLFLFLRLLLFSYLDVLISITEFRLNPYTSIDFWNNISKVMGVLKSLVPVFSCSNLKFVEDDLRKHIINMDLAAYWLYVCVVVLLLLCFCKQFCLHWKTKTVIDLWFMFVRHLIESFLLCTLTSRYC